MTDTAISRDELAKELQQGHHITEVVTLLTFRKAEPVGYILGGSIVFAGLVILVITAIKGKKEEEDSA